MLSRLQILERALNEYHKSLKIYENNSTPKKYGEVLATKKRHKKESEVKYDK